MIQRIQTVYLLLAALCAALNAVLGAGVPWLWIASVVMALGAVGTIFLYQQRPLQATLCTVLMAVGVVYYLAVGAYQHTLGGTLQFTWPMALPALAIVCCFMARKRIMKDEKLVRSLDRIR